MGMPVNKPGTITREESTAHIIESIAAQESFCLFLSYIIGGF